MSNPLFIGKVLHDFEKLPSTNGYALDMLSKSNPPEGTVISTYNQHQGRGQIGSNWESEPGRNLSISVILYPKFLGAQQQSLLNQAIALACRAFLASYTTKKVEVKWPNDLIVEGKKIGGILIQNAISGRSLQSSVIGIGINVNQRQFTKAPNPTSLALLGQKFFDLNSLRQSLFKHLEAAYIKLKAGNYQAFEEEYILHLYRFGESCLFEQKDGQVFRGSIHGTSPAGKLKIQTANGILEFGIKEIKFAE